MGGGAEGERDLLNPYDRSALTYNLIKAEIQVLAKLEGTHKERIATLERER